MTSSVAVVGGGLAGLSCLHELRKLGISSRLFEAEKRVGGRIYTYRAPGGGHVDLGAGYFHRYYGRVHELLHELDLAAKIRRRTSDGTGMVIADQLIEVRAKAMLRAYKDGLLGLADLRSFVQLYAQARLAGVHMRRHFTVRSTGQRLVRDRWIMDARQRPFSELSRHLSPLIVQFIDAVARKQLHQPASGLNLAAALLILSSAAVPLYTLEGGLDQLPLRIAERHAEHIVIDCAIQKLRPVTGGYFLATRSGDELGPFRHVVLALPLALAAQLCGRPIGRAYARARVLVIRGTLRPALRGPGKLYFLGARAGIHGLTDYRDGIYKLGVEPHFDATRYFLEHEVLHEQDWLHGLPSQEPGAPLPAPDQENGLWLAGDHELPCMEAAAHAGLVAAVGIKRQLERGAT